jgi:hypothetical protein
MQWAIVIDELQGKDIGGGGVFRVSSGPAGCCLLKIKSCIHFSKQNFAGRKGSADAYETQERYCVLRYLAVNEFHRKEKENAEVRRGGLRFLAVSAFDVEAPRASNCLP